jgi:hypothetical protein
MENRTNWLQIGEITVKAAGGALCGALLGGVLLGAAGAWARIGDAAARRTLSPAIAVNVVRDALVMMMRGYHGKIYPWYGPQHVGGGLAEGATRRRGAANELADFDQRCLSVGAL